MCFQNELIKFSKTAQDKTILNAIKRTVLDVVTRNRLPIADQN